MEPRTEAEQVEFEKAVLEAAEELIKLKNMRGWKIMMLALGRDADKAADAMVEHDATDIAGMQKLQSAVKRFKWFGDTIEELIATGIQPELLEEEIAYGEEP